MKARDYQEFAVESIYEWFRKGNRGNPLIAAPTGVGKSIIIALFVQRTLAQWPGQRILMLTHVKELIEQNHDKLKQLWPKAPVGLFSAGIGKKELQYPITFAGVQSIARSADKLGHIDVVLVDEAHRIPDKTNTQYQKVLAKLRQRNPRLVVIGLTATPFRLGGGYIYGEDKLFAGLCCDMTSVDAFNWFLDQGYLAWLVPKPTSIEIDVSQVATVGGDYNQAQLQEMSDKEHITKEAVSEILKVAAEQNRNHWLIFATGVDHCEHIVQELERCGVRAAAVHSKMSDSERDANIARFQSGYITALVNMGVLTTGFDAPHIDLIAMLRCTKSVALWVQMLGRGTRPDYAEGFDLTTQEGRLEAIRRSLKPNCIVLDFAANTERLGCINDPNVPDPKRKNKGKAPVRICDGCNTKIHASLRRCPHCGKEFPPEVKFDENASTSELIAKGKKKKKDKIIIGVFAVDQVFYQRRATRNGNPDYVEVCYYCGMRRFSQPLSFEHPNAYARHKSREWWRKASGTEVEPPDTTEAALARINVGEIGVPKFIRVHTNAKPYPQILFVDYEGFLAKEAEEGEKDVSL